MTERLLPSMDAMAKDDLSDTLYAIASNIEDALLASGAEPGSDYTRLDLFNLAQPFALEVFKADATSFSFPAKQAL